MKLVIQRVTHASVEVEGEITGQIEACSPIHIIRTHQKEQTIIP